jgi:uncharacterized protein (DUF58 family)
VSPTPRAAGLLALAALSALVVPVPVAALIVLVLVGGALADARAVRHAPELERQVPGVLSRGVAASFGAAPRGSPPGRVRLRQPAPPELLVAPPEHDGAIEGEIRALRRGRHTLPSAAARFDGPFGLGRYTHRLGEDHEVLVYPDMPSAARVVQAVRDGSLGEESRRRGALGLGTEFESVREYLPDDDVRQINWRATARLGRPMSNQYRVEQDRDMVCLLDAGRLMGAPIGERTRLDAAVDAAVTVALVADEVGDHAGCLAFDDGVRVRLPPARAGGAAVVRALFDLEPSWADTDYELAFRAVGGAKRAWVLVLTDLLEEAAAGPLLEAVPVLARRHAVAVASVRDTDLEALVSTPPLEPRDAYAAAMAVEVLSARERVAGHLRRAGAQVIEAPPGALGAACARAYLSAKGRASV